MPPSSVIRILHLEDSARDAELIAEQLTADGEAYDVLVVDSEQRFESALADSKVGLILLDYNIPNCYGPNAVRMARQRRPDIPIVIVSGMMDEEEAVECLRLGATDYVLKQRLARLAPVVRRAVLEAEEHRRAVEAENQLRDSETQLREAQAVAHLGSWTFDVAQQHFVCSAETVRIFGLPLKASFVFEEFLPNVHPDDRKLLDRSWRAARSGERPYDLVYRVLVGGAEKWVHDRARLTRDNAGRVVRVVGTTQDVSEQERNRRALAGSERFVRATLSALADRIAVLDEEGHILKTNLAWRAFAQESGRALSRLDEGANYLSICEEASAQGLPGKAVIAALVRELLGGRREQGSVEYAVPSLEGERWFLCRASRFSYDGPVLVVLSHTDITARKRAEEALRQLNLELEGIVAARTAELERASREAESANRAKSDFLAAMSHEIRTPMNGVIGMIDVLHQSSLTGDQVEMVDLVRESANSLLGIIDDILDFSKIEADHLQIERVPLRVEEIVQRVCVMLDRLAGKAEVDVTLFIDPAMPEQALGDPGRLRQVLINLVGNAIKFSRGQPRRGRVSVRATLAERTSEQVIAEFQVADNGIGMDTTVMSRLFTPFTQADASTTRRFGGTGLGLAISRRLVELMGGQIAVRSAVGEGSTFTVRIPIVPLPSTIEASAAAPSVAGLCCVVVGDIEGLGDDLAVYLSRGGATVFREREMVAAREHASAYPPGLLVWVIDTDEERASPEELLANTRVRPDLDAPRVIVAVERGRRRKARRARPEVILVDGNVLSCNTLLSAVAMAAGRAATQTTDDAGRQGEVARLPLTREDALRQGRLILVAEDNETNQKVIMQQLRLLGFAVDIVANGRDAMQRWETCPYSMVLTDLHMPEMDGYQLTSAIRAAEAGGRRTPIIALTANVLKGEADRCRMAGMDDYVSKPLALADLKAVLDKWQLQVRSAPDSTTTVFRQPMPESTTAARVDISVLKKIVGEDAAVLQEVLRDFRASAVHIVAELRAACAAGQSSAAGAVAHKLKSSARAVGALALGELCADLERVGKTGDNATLGARLPLFEAELAAVDLSISQLLARESAVRTS